MRPTATYNLSITDLVPARKRLFIDHNEMGSWHRVARKLRLNVRSVYNYALYGILPRNPKTIRKLLGRKTINEHLEADRIEDMPVDLLEWALEHREEMK